MIERLSPARVGLLAVLAAFLVAGDARGQAVQGRLLDAETSASIANGTISLVNAADSTVASTISNEQGEFVLRVSVAGEYRLRGQRIGYTTSISSPIAVPERGVVEVVFRLSANAIALEPISVVARRTSRLTPGSIVNQERRARGLGVFLTQADILAKTQQDVRDALRDVDGIRVGMGRNGLDCRLGRGRGSGIPLWDRNCLISSEGWGCMNIVVNELPLPVEDFDLTTIIPRPDQVAAIEVYRSYREVPDEHKFLAWPITQREPCGLVAIWTHAAW